MSIDTNKKVVETFFDRITAQDIDGTLRLLADSFEFWVAGDPQSFALGGSKNRTQYSEMLRAFFPTFPKGFAFVSKGVTAEGDRVAVEAEWIGETSRGRRYHNRYHILFELRDGKIRSMREYHDTLHAQEILLSP
jgi:ketosteroid isomerase-like protein